MSEGVRVPCTLHPQSAMDIPSRSQRASSSARNPSLQMPSSESLPSDSVSSSSGMGHRSGLAASHPRTNHRVMSGFRRVAEGASPKEPWSLFEQRMENEGQLRTPLAAANAGVTRGTTHRASPLDTDNTNLDSSPQHSSPVNLSILHRSFDVQSPTNDPFLEAQEYFPPISTPSNRRSETCSERDPEEDASSSDESIDDPPWYSFQNLPAFPTLYKSILKCGIAYFIASLFTFTPFLSGLIADIASYGPGKRGPSPSGHLVATVAVYYNPAKTTGAMAEADFFCTIALLFSSFVCLCSMSLFWWLDVKPGWEWLADALVVLWIGISMSGVAWMKVWMSKPSFNTACSMTAIILFIVLVKEGGLEMLLHVTFIVFAGATVSNFVCICIWPQSAANNLQTTMAKSLDSFSTLLRLLTNTFLLEEPLQQPSDSKLQRAIESHQSSFTNLKRSLDEAQSEWFFQGSGYGKSGASGRRAYEDAVGTLNRLAQHLNGLRSGTRLQYELAKAYCDGKVVLRGRHPTPNASQGPNLFGVDSLNGKGKGVGPSEEENDALLQGAAVMFGDLVDELGPPLKALSNTCSTTLKRMRKTFVQQPRSRKEAIQEREFQELADGIQRSLFAFESTSNHAVMRLYRRSDFASTDSADNSLDMDNSILAGNESEHVFLVYFFIFTLQEFARELISLVDAMERINLFEQQAASRSWWGWLRSWFPATFIKKPSNGEKRKSSGLKRRISAVFVPHNRPKPSFPKIRPHAPDTIQTPSWSKLTPFGRVKQTLWALGSRLKERDVKFALKAGMATAVLATPAFLDATRPTFMEYRGEWALISFFVVISPTIGATNFLSVHRILATLFGAGVATGIYTLFPHNPYILSIFGFFYSLPCFYIILTKPEYAISGRFVLLTYNLTCLYSYNARSDVSVREVAFHRSASVTVGVLWAAVVSRIWWPAEARRELSKALGDFCLNTGWLYTRLLASNSFDPVQEGAIDTIEGDSTAVTESTPLLSTHANSKLVSSIHEFMSMELHLQIKLIEIQGLLAQTAHEPRLKGPFPVQLYRSVLTSLQTILDRLHSMRCVTTREEWFTTVRRDFILPVNREARELAGNIILALSNLAFAFRLKAPLPPYLPPAETSRQRLVAAIRKLDVVKNRDVKGSRQLLFFAYALTMKGVTQELESLGQALQHAFGVIGQTPEEFESLFQDPSQQPENNA